MKHRLQTSTPAFWGGTALAILSAVSGILALIFTPFIVGIGMLIIALGTALAVVWSFWKLIPLIQARETADREMRNLIESVEDGVIIYSTDFVIASMNEAACRITAVSRETALQRAITPDAVSDKVRSRLAQIVFPSLAPRAFTISAVERWPQITELTLENPRAELKTTTHRILDANGKIRGFIKILHNTTRESALLELKSDFINVAAHQLRTPLTALGWSLENIAKMLGSSTPEITKLVSETRELAARSLKITNDLLDTARIEEGKFGFALETVDMRGIIEETVRIARPAAELRSISLTTQLPPKPLLVNADASKLSTALLNIVDNAIRYNTEQGTVSVTAQAEGQRAVFSVRDSGIGIPEQDRPKLFSKMRRGSNAAAHEPNGSGLGLFITKNIIEGHHGTITIDSIEKRGTTVTVAIPLAS